MAEPFPLPFPPDARRPFGSEEFIRRLARMAQWTSGSRVLELEAGTASLLLAKEFGCAVTAIDADEAAVQSLKERVKGQSLTDRISVRQASFQDLPFGEGEFEGILALGRVPLSLDEGVQLRRHLAPSGRLVWTYPVKVGRYPAKIATDFWDGRLGETMRLPRELLMAVEANGFEPETVETLSDAELDDYYRSIEPQVKKLDDSPASRAIRDELELHRSQGGKSSVSWAVVVGRRREPGEKPPASRDSG